MIVAVYAFGSKDIWGSLFIGTFGTIILRFLMGLPLALHWSLANGVHLAVIALFSKIKNKKLNWLKLIIGASIGSLVYPLASIITYVIYKSETLAIGQGFFYAGISILFSIPVIIIHPIIKNYFDLNKNVIKEVK